MITRISGIHADFADSSLKMMTVLWAPRSNKKAAFTRKAALQEKWKILSGGNIVDCLSQPRLEGFELTWGHSGNIPELIRKILNALVPEPVGDFAQSQLAVSEQLFCALDSL